MKSADSGGELRCSFCSKSQDVVRKLVSSPSSDRRAYICDECIAVCNSILADDEVERFLSSASKDHQTVEETANQNYLAGSIYGHCKRVQIDRASSDIGPKVLVMGPAGRWRMFTAQLVARILRVPFIDVELPKPLHSVLPRPRGTE